MRMSTVRRLALGGCALLAGAAQGQVRPEAGMLRTPDVSAEWIVFSYANDLWLWPREGGMAIPLASPAGEETTPRFSPDGGRIAFVGNYEGNRDIYVMDVPGGVPQRVTHHPGAESLCGWTPDGRLLFSMRGMAEMPKTEALYTIDPAGGPVEELPIPYGANGAVSGDGEWLAFTPWQRDARTWKRYRGGMATDVWLFNLKDGSSRRVTDWEGTDTQPMWSEGALYYLSDEGPEHRLNIWRYDVGSGERRQVTRFSEWDVRWPSEGSGANGRGEIIFQNGSDLYVLDVRDGTTSAIDVVIPGARPKLATRRVDASEFIDWWSLSPSAKRVAVEARGDVWTLPAEHGSPRNLSRTSGVRERFPSWSPDGATLAFFGDQTGEWELYVRSADGKGEPRRLTEGNTDSYYFMQGWSPDSAWVVFTDQDGGIHLVNAESGERRLVDRDGWGFNSPMSPGYGGQFAWSHDSRWMAYALPTETHLASIWIYSVEDDASSRATSGYFHDSLPTFDRKGDWLYFVSSREFSSPDYGDMDTTFIYDETEIVVAVPLREDVESPYLAKSDEEEGKADSDDEESGEDGDDEGEGDGDGDDADAPDDGLTGSWSITVKGQGIEDPDGATSATMFLELGADGSVTGSIATEIGEAEVTSGRFDRSSGSLTLELSFQGAPVSLRGTVTGGSISGTVTSAALGFDATFEGERIGTGEDGEGSGGDTGKAREVVEIEFDGLEMRAMKLPIARGGFRQLRVNDKNQLVYVRTGESGASIKLFDPSDEKQEEKDVASGAGSFDMSADGKKLLVLRGGSSASIQDASAGSSGKPVVKDGMTALIDPRLEWKQLFHEAWRTFRDYFYDPGMHGVDWRGVRDQYERMLADCTSREDVAHVIREMISELNVGHAYYRGGGDVEREPSVSVGLLGCDFELDGGAYRIARIHRGGAWDVDAKGPLSEPGVGVREGDYLLAVNGVPLDPSRDPWWAFVGATGRSVTLTVSEKPEYDEDAREVVVRPMTDEFEVRYRSWIESKRAHVDRETGGRVGYIHVPDTGINGQNNLIRQFFGQRHKDALIIDERWNSGGQIPTRFIELLSRTPVNYWARPVQNDWPWPPDAHFGPKVMLINGLSGSGGDAFPAYFRQAGLGKLIGTRTWGGLVGISGNPALIDGANISVPTFGYYETDGTWGIEGHGVDPDIEVIDDPALLAQGQDPQLDRAIEVILEELEAGAYRAPARPAFPDRSRMGITEEDK